MPPLDATPESTLPTRAPRLAGQLPLVLMLLRLCQYIPNIFHIWSV